MDIVFASNNNGKINQVKKFINYANVLSLKDCGICIDVEETGTTFEENAIIKAKEISKFTDKIVIADDSGLEINEYNGWPGVYTHRFLGENCTSEQRNDYILEKMKGLPYEKRACTIKCVIAVSYKGIVKTFTGEFNSHILEKKIGDNNFGFDEITETSNGQSVACLCDEDKLKVNARSMALKKASEYIKTLNN